MKTRPTRPTPCNEAALLRKIKMTIGDVEITAELFETETADAITVKAVT